MLLPWAVVLSAGACVTGPTLAPMQGPTPGPATAFVPVTIDTPVLFEASLEPVRHVVDAPPFDEIMASPVLADPDFEADVLAWVEYWSVDAASAMPTILGRMAAFEARVDSALEVAGLPPSLRFLPLIESGYNPSAASVASAVGMWQFMEGTARGMGMEVSRLMDERRDPVRSTEAAIGFLTELRESFGSWFMALAAYNGGPTRLRGVLRRYAPDTEPSDSLFWALREHFPRETRQFVPKLIGAALVAGRPQAFGIGDAESPTPFAYDEVAVPDATTLDVVALAAEVPLDEIERLNPHFTRGMTPPGRATGVRVPTGQGEVFARNYAEIPEDERVTFVEHRVEPGDTLSHIALRYGVLVADLTAANPGLRPRFLRIGGMLTVPVAPSVRSGAAGS